jgi:hypothetical protein
VGDTTTKSNSEYFNDFYNDAYITLTEGFDVPYINIEKKNSVTQQGFTYIKKTIYFKENNLIWSTIVVFDDHSDKIAGIGYYSPFEKHKYYEVYLNNILDSITFT